MCDVCLCVCGVCACVRGAPRLLLSSVHLNNPQGTLPIAQPNAGSSVKTSDSHDYSETHARGYPRYRSAEEFDWMQRISIPGEQRRSLPCRTAKQPGHFPQQSLAANLKALFVLLTMYLLHLPPSFTVSFILSCSSPASEDSLFARDSL